MFSISPHLYSSFCIKESIVFLQDSMLENEFALLLVFFFCIILYFLSFLQIQINKVLSVGLNRCTISSGLKTEPEFRFGSVRIYV